MRGRATAAQWCSFLSFGLATMDGLEGKNRCELHIWPVSEKPKPEVLVRWQPEYGAAMSANVRWRQTDMPGQADDVWS
jgi:hypothetical protein